MRRGAFVALAGAAAAVAPRAARAQSATIRLSAVPTETLIEPVYALECGAFARAGLDVDLHLFNASPVANQAMAARAIDVCANDPLQLTNAINHGLPFQYFAGGLIHRGDAPTTLLCVAKNGPVKTARDLEGQAIAVPTVLNLASLSVRDWMAQQGADPQKARFVELPGPAMVPAIARGTIGGAMLSEPFVTFSSDDTRVLADTYDVVGSRFILNAYYARRDWLADRADLARRLATAFYDTARWVDAHPAESLQILAKYSKLEPARLAAVRRAHYAVALDAALLRPVVEIGLKYRAFERAVAPAEMIAKL